MLPVANKRFTTSIQMKSLDNIFLNIDISIDYLNNCVKVNLPKIENSHYTQ